MKQTKKELLEQLDTLKIELGREQIIKRESIAIIDDNKKSFKRVKRDFHVLIHLLNIANRPVENGFEEEVKEIEKIFSKVIEEQVDIIFDYLNREIGEVTESQGN